MNVPLLLKVKQAILDEPKRADIWTWQTRADNDDAAPACGTIGCIAGWADLISRTGGSLDAEDIRSLETIGSQAVASARSVLGISYEQSQALFQPDLWPEYLHERICETDSQTQDHAQVIADAIDCFIDDPEQFLKYGADALEFRQ